MKKLKFIIIIVCSLPLFSFLTVDAQTYDMEIILNKIRCLKVVEAPFDTQEEIFGTITLAGYVLKNQAGTLERYGTTVFTPSFYSTAPIAAGSPYVPFSFFSKGASKPLVLGENQTSSPGLYFSRSGLKYDQLISFEGLLGGFLKEEDFRDVTYKPCSSCSYFSSSTLDYRLIRMVYYQSQIDAMVAGTSKFLTIGDDTIMELNYFEGDNNSSHIRFEFKIKITKKA